MAVSAVKGRSVCVTGAGGYVASWLVKLLLSRNYVVHGTVRDPDDAKHNHLKSLDKASENLKLFKADLLDYNSLYAAIKGCNGVFHVASPVPSNPALDPEVELVEPTVKGTLNVLKACSAANVKRTVVVSSRRAVAMTPNWPEGQVKDETCWSDCEYCKATNNWYSFAKTVAEIEAWEYAKQNGLDLVAVCPTLILGPMLQHASNASSLVLIKLAKDCPRHTLTFVAFKFALLFPLDDKEGHEETDNKLQLIVDVRDVAEALVLVYERPEAEGRYICTAHVATTGDIVEILRSNYPNYNYPKRFKEVKNTGKLSSEKLQRLGWKYRQLEETLVDSIKSFRHAGHLD